MSKLHIKKRHNIVVYVAGPLRANSAWGVESNIRRAERIAISLLKNYGISYICPHTNFRFTDGSIDDDTMIEVTKELVRRSDAVYLCPGWKKSKGTMGEVKLAEELDIQVLSNKGELEKWLKNLEQLNLLYLPNQTD